jgi:chaperonin GroEL
MRGILKVAAVKAPDFGERRTLILEDIAVLTGGTVVSSQKGMRLDKFNKDWFGEARTITVGKDTTTIVDGKGDTKLIEARLEELKSQIDNSVSPYEVEKLQERLSKMIGGVAIINVGGGTEIEMKEKKDRLDDALQATKAALDEGILPGAGVALLHASRTLSADLDRKDDIAKGAMIVFKACSEPFKQILKNAGEEPNEWLMQLLKTTNMVPNIADGKITDAIESGIIDPTKVVRSALENAAAAAVTLLMTECVIHEKPSEKKNEGGMGMDMMGGMM